MAFKKSFVVAATMAVAAFGAALEGIDDCASIEPSAEFLAVAKEMAAQEAAAVNSPNKRADGEPDIIVPTYLHVVASSQDSAGYLSTEQVLGTLDHVNNNYLGVGFQFDVQDVDHTINATWAANQEQLAMKKHLRKGDYKTLNIYFLDKLSGYNGYCYYPEAVTTNSSKFFTDGCTINAGYYRNNQTTTHEVGHWFGLIHTFQGGCNGTNDEIDDTPAMINHWSCNKTDDTCPDQPGRDPVNNFMSYGYCRNEFTPGQVARMNNMYQKFRA